MQAPFLPFADQSHSGLKETKTNYLKAYNALESVWFTLNQNDLLKVLIVLHFMPCLLNKQNMKCSSTRRVKLNLLCQNERPCFASPAFMSASKYLNLFKRDTL